MIEAVLGQAKAVWEHVAHRTGFRLVLLEYHLFWHQNHRHVVHKVLLSVVLHEVC